LENMEYRRLSQKTCAFALSYLIKRKEIDYECLPQAKPCGYRQFLFIPFNNFRYNSPAVQTDWESVPIHGTAEGAIPVTAQAHEPIGTGKSGERQGQLLVASR
jgi:hypothetical protein